MSVAVAAWNSIQFIKVRWKYPWICPSWSKICNARIPEMAVWNLQWWKYIQNHAKWRSWDQKQVQKCGVLIVRKLQFGWNRIKMMWHDRVLFEEEGVQISKRCVLILWDSKCRAELVVSRKTNNALNADHGSSLQAKMISWMRFFGIIQSAEF